MMDPRNGEGEAQSTNAADQSPTDSMRDEGDTQNSAANGITTTADVTAQFKSTSKASSTRNSTPASTSMEMRNSAQPSNDASASGDALNESRDASNATVNPAQSSSKDFDENGAAPYGTRSRNRPGRSRPNYAEDTEMDFEMTAAPANGNTSDPPSRNSVAAENGQLSGVGGKKGSGSAQGNASWGNSGSISKESPANPSISGAPAVAAPAANQPSSAQPPVKRRKNAATTNGTQSTAAAAAPSQAGAKRGNHVMVAANSARESNMLTFENTRAVLKDGRMEADDGQTVSINGKF
jgi:hypothetical protein